MSTLMRTDDPCDFMIIQGDIHHNSSVHFSRLIIRMISDDEALVVRVNRQTRGHLRLSNMSRNGTRIIAVKQGLR